MATDWLTLQTEYMQTPIWGAALLIHEADGEPQKYRADGLGNFSHVGYYVGENALTDTDQNGNARVCNCVHSSATMGRVAGSTLKNGWTHAAWFTAVDYGDSADSGAAENETGAVAEAVTEAVTETATATETVTETATEAATEAETEAVAAFYTVRKGCLGGAVRRLQTWLSDLGYALGSSGIDGDFGALTDAAVRAFQTAQALRADGIVGQKTWAALYEARQTAARGEGV